MSKDRAALRPLPLADPASQPYWDACARRELRLQRCEACSEVRFPPQPQCPACASPEATWQPGIGLGSIASFVVCHPPVLPAFAERTPYVVVLVELDDGPHLRMVGNLLEADPNAVRIGQRV